MFTNKLFEILRDISPAIGRHKNDRIVTHSARKTRTRHRKSWEERLARLGHIKKHRQEVRRSELPARKSAQRKPRPKKAKAYRNR